METHNKLNFSGLECIASQRGYEVTEDGVFCGVRNNILKHKNKGYLCVSISVNGKNKSLYAHRLQAYQKYGEDIYQQGICVRHLNGDKSDNSFDNIAIGTNRDNVMDRTKSERKRIANLAARQTIKYNKDEVVQYYNNCNRSRKKTIEHFGMSQSGLHYILNDRKQLSK